MAVHVWAPPTPASSIVGLTPNQILYGAPDGTIGQSSSLQWDATNNRLGVGMAPSASGTLMVGGATPSIGLQVTGQTAAQFASVDSPGNVYIGPTHAAGLYFFVNGQNRAAILSGGNVILGSTTNGSGRVQISAAGGVPETSTASGSIAGLGVYGAGNHHNVSRDVTNDIELYWGTTGTSIGGFIGTSTAHGMGFYAAANLKGWISNAGNAMLAWGGHQSPGKTTSAINISLAGPSGNAATVIEHWRSDAQTTGIIGGYSFGGGASGTTQIASIQGEWDGAADAGKVVIYNRVAGGAITATATFTSTGNVVVGHTGAANARLDIARASNAGPQIRIGTSSTDNGAYFLSTNANQLIASAGSAYSGSAWVAKSAATSLLTVEAGNFMFSSDTGLVAGNTFSPTERMRFNSAGQLLIGSSTATLGRLQVTIGGTPENTAVGAGQGVELFNNSSAYYIARHITSDVESVYGVSNGGVGLVGTISAHPFQIIVGNANRFEIAAGNTVASSAGATWNAYNVPAFVQPVSGTTAITTATGFNLVNIAAPSITNGSAVTISHAATMYIAGPPTGGGAGPVTITNAYSLWVDSGRVRLDGRVTNGGGAAATMGTIGGSGPAAAAQSGWLPINVDGTNYFLPLWA